MPSCRGHQQTLELFKTSDFRPCMVLFSLPYYARDKDMSSVKIFFRTRIDCIIFTNRMDSGDGGGLIIKRYRNNVNREWLLCSHIPCFPWHSSRLLIPPLSSPTLWPTPTVECDGIYSLQRSGCPVHEI